MKATLMIFICVNPVQAEFVFYIRASFPAYTCIPASALEPDPYFTFTMLKMAEKQKNQDLSLEYNAVFGANTAKYARMGYVFWSSKPGDYAIRSVWSISCDNREPAAQTDSFLGSLLSDTGDDVSSSPHLYSRHRFIEFTSCLYHDYFQCRAGANQQWTNI